MSPFYVTKALHRNTVYSIPIVLSEISGIFGYFFLILPYTVRIATRIAPLQDKHEANLIIYV